MQAGGERPSWVRRRWWWLLIAAAVVYLLAFDWLAGLLRPEQETLQTRSISGNATVATEPALPTLRRLDGGGIEIRHDLFRRTTIRLGDEAEEQALFDCLQHGFDEAFGNGSEGWTPARARREAKRVQDECVSGSLDLPELPGLPPQSDAAE